MLMKDLTTCQYHCIKRQGVFTKNFEGTFIVDFNKIKDVKYKRLLEDLYAPVFNIDSTDTLAKIAVRLKAFNSNAEAKKNGFSDKLPTELGETEYSIKVPFNSSDSSYMPKYKSSFSVFVVNPEEF